MYGFDWNDVFHIRTEFDVVVYGTFILHLEVQIGIRLLNQWECLVAMPSYSIRSFGIPVYGGFILKSILVFINTTHESSNVMGPLEPQLENAKGQVPLPLMWPNAVDSTLLL